MNFNTLTPDSTKLISNYSSGRGSKSIDRIILHHNAGKLSHTGVYNAFKSNGTSAHYNVDSSGTICQYVKLANTAWHCGNFAMNQRSIGIEHCNTSNKSPWSIPDKTLDAGAHLVAALCKKYGLGEPSYGKNVFFHSDVVSTSCPGSIAGSQKSEYFSTARDYYAEMTGSSASSGDIWQIDVDGIWGTETTKLAQAIEGIIQSGYVYNQPTGNKGCFALSSGQCWCFKFTSSPKSGGSLLVRRIQNDLGWGWSECDGYFGANTTKRFIDKYVTNADTYKLLYPSIAVKGYQKELNEKAKLLGLTK